MSKHGMTHATNSTNLAELLERVLDKGVVVAGDIKIKLVEIELLTIQIRLVICSVERAVEMGMDWWQRDPHLSSRAAQPAAVQAAAEPAGLAQPWMPPGAVPVLSQPPEAASDAMERRMRGMEDTLRRMEAQLASLNPSRDPNR